MTYDAVCCYGEMTILAGVGGGGSDFKIWHTCVTHKL